MARLTDEALATIEVKRAIGTLANRYPFHGALLARFRLVPSGTVATMGVRLVREGVELTFSPSFVIDLPDDELLGVLHHEVNHVLFGHLLVPPSNHPDRRARRIAEEVTVNEWVPEPLPGDPIVLADFPDLPPDEDTDARYHRLAGRVGSEREGNPVDDPHRGWGGAVDPTTRTLGATSLRAMLADIAEALGSAEVARLPSPARAILAGTRPGGHASVGAGGRSRVDWRGVLRSTIVRAVTPTFRLGTPPRRAPALVGVFPGRVWAPRPPHVLAVIDSSGSVPEPALAAMRSELEVLMRFARVTAMVCDVHIHFVGPLAELPSRLRGRGGTDLRPPFAPDILGRHRPDVVVYLTDGAGPTPCRPPPIPVVWCLVPGGSPPARWGRVVRMTADDGQAL